MYVKEVYSENADLVNLGKERVKWQVVLQTVMRFSLP